MSKRKRNRQSTGTAGGNLEPSSTHAPQSSRASDPLRRLLLLAVVALLVARPLVLGEDPGMTASLTDASNLVLTIAWLFVGVGWALWRYRSRQREAHGGGIVEAALAACVLLTFFSAGASAAYQHPAWLIAWEWLVFLLTLFLVRRLAVTETEQRCVVAVLLANFVSISALGLYQYHVALPRDGNDREREIAVLQAEVEREKPAHEAFALAAGGGTGLATWRHLRGEALIDTQNERELARQQVRQERFVDNYGALGTFYHANSFAAYLILLIPSLVMIAWMRWRNARRRWKTWVTILCTALSLYVLVLTGSRGATLALLFASIFAVALALWRGLLSRRPAVVLWALLLIAVVLVHFNIEGNEANGATVRQRNWAATWSMISDHPWLGVGSGNLDRHYPQYATTSAWDPPREPKNFALEIWSSSGLFALAALMIALIGFAHLFRRHFHRTAQIAEEPRDDTTPRERWEYYVAGMLGLFFGYVLRETSVSAEEVLGGFRATSPDAVLKRAFAACARCVVWFGTFALLENCTVPRRARLMGLSIGFSALLLALCVTNGISYPSVAQPMWAVLGLMLCALAVPQRQSIAENRLVPVIALPVCGGLALTYLLVFALPALESNRLAVRSMQASRFQSEAGVAKGAYLREQVVEPLQRAVEAAPQNSRRLEQLSAFSQTFWLWLHDHAPENKKLQLTYRDLALDALTLALRNDPMNARLYRQNSQLYQAVAAATPVPAEKLSRYCVAVANLKKANELDPANPYNHYLLAQGYARIYNAFVQWPLSKGESLLTKHRPATSALSDIMQLNEVDPRQNPLITERSLRLRISEEMRGAAGFALELDAAAHRARKLTDTQRGRAKQWRLGVENLN